MPHEWNVFVSFQELGVASPSWHNDENNRVSHLAMLVRGDPSLAHYLRAQQALPGPLQMTLCASHSVKWHIYPLKHPCTSLNRKKPEQRALSGHEMGSESVKCETANGVAIARHSKPSGLGVQQCRQRQARDLYSDGQLVEPLKRYLDRHNFGGE
jgi:hypothetical protein